MRRLFGWLLLLPGILLVFSGLVDIAVGPELAEQDGGGPASEGASRWYGLVIIAIGIAVIALGHRLSRRDSLVAPDQDRSAVTPTTRNPP